MGIEEITGVSGPSVFSQEDRIMNTTKMVERTFGLPVGDVGEVIMQDDRAVLSFTYKGAAHILRWLRTQRGGIAWYLDDSEQPILLGEPGRAMQRLVRVLDR